MKRCAAFFVVGTLLPAALLADPPPVGISDGDVVFEEAGIPGTKLFVGAWPGTVGTYTLSTGDTLSFSPGTGSVGVPRRPAIIVGGGDFVTGGNGTLVLSNGSTIDMTGNQGGPAIFVGEEQGVGSFSALSGSSVIMQDLNLLDAESRVVMSVGRTNGTLNFDDSTLTMTSSSGVALQVAEDGAFSGSFGEATFSNGSTVTIEEVAAPGAISRIADIRIGHFAGNTGIVTVSGSTLLLSSETGRARVLPGNSGGNGTLNLENAASMTVSGGFRGEISVGRDDGSVGALNVSGGSNLLVTGPTQSWITFAGTPGATGTGLFQDSSVTLQSDVKTEIGLADGGGNADLIIENSTVTLESGNDSAIFVAVGSGTAELTITGGSLVDLLLTGTTGIAQVFVGGGFKGPGADGTLIVDDASTLNITSAQGSRLNIGEEGATGRATVSGAGTSVNLQSGTIEQNLLRVGRGAGSFGTLDVLDGAAINMTGSDTVFELGRGGNGFGAATVTGGASISVGGDFGRIFVGDDNPGVGDAATGILTVAGSGSRVSAASEFNIGALSGTGTTNAVVTVANGGSIEAPNIRIGSGGVVGGNGTLIGSVTLSGTGVLSPGLSPGQLTIDGDLILEGGVLDLEIAGADSTLQDLIVANRIFSESAFDMMIKFVGGYTPEVGDTFTLLKATEIVGDVFGNASLIFSEGFAGSLFADGEGGIGLTVTSIVAPVPLPAPAILLLGALALLGATTRGRKQSDVTL